MTSTQGYHFQDHDTANLTNTEKQRELNKMRKQRNTTQMKEQDKKKSQVKMEINNISHRVLSNGHNDTVIKIL